MKNPILKEYIICYIDILGYENLIKQMGESCLLQIINDAYEKVLTQKKNGVVLDEINKTEKNF